MRNVSSAMKPLAILAILTLAPFALRAQTSSPNTFLNITLGESAQAVVASLGDPLVHRSRDIQDVPTDEFLYIAPTGKAVEYLEIMRGNVIGVRALPAPNLKSDSAPPSALGIALGAPASSVDTLPKNTRTYKGRSEGGIIETYRGPGGLLYSFVYKPAGTITQIAVRLPETIAAHLAHQPAPMLHGGKSPNDAIVVKAPNEDAGNQFIGVFLSVNPCGGGDGYWKPTGPGTATAYNAHPMAKVEAECTSGAAKQTFWFDVRAFYGTSPG